MMITTTVYNYSNKPQRFVTGTEQKGCHLPRPNPFDPSIMEFFIKPEPLRCNGTQPELTYLSDDEWLHVNRTAIIATGLSLVCFYRCYDRVEGDDLELQYSEWIQINNQTRPGCEFIETYCKKTTFPGKVVYHNNHNQVLRRNLSSIPINIGGKKNVIVIVFDSISHSNFIRNMPKSLEVLTSLYGSHIFDGMSKIGDQSFPNAVAFLAGRDYATEFGDTKGFFDNHPLIWKDFEQAGYSTYYAEDYPNFNLFYYLAKGFRQKPVHHYFRPFWLNVYGSYLHRRSKFLCYGNHAMHNIQLNYLSQFLRKYKDSPKFALNWLTELGHDYMNQINVADEDFAKFLADHFEILKDSFLFVLGDHGHRFDSIRRTTIGRIEERFPFFSMHIPEDIHGKFPLMNRTVHENTQVLTSFWDFYATMQDILQLDESNAWKHLNDHTSNSTSKISSRGSSLLRPIRDRNCREAGIPDEFCMCHEELALDTNEPRVRQLASTIISHLNNLLASSRRCAKLTLARILHATVVDQYDKSSQSEARYRLTIEAKPAGALFEALLKFDPALNTSTVYGTVNRVNAYGNQSSCVYEQELRKFCYCI
nr:Protein of unknown function DUF229 domain containing protein [Haemonchus contortus]